jgi:hypothetical protein
MSMKRTFVADLFSSALTPWRDMVNFDEIIILEVQSTPAAFSCLLLQEFAFGPVQQVMFAESLAPIHEVSIIWAGRSFDFDMPLDMRLRVIPQSGFPISEYPATAFIHMPVLVGDPTFAFVWMAVSGPLLELEKQNVFTVVEDFGGNHCSMIPRPSTHFRM